MTVTKSTCPYCGVGCGVLIESEGSKIINVQGDPQHPANFGRLCTKGSTLHLTAAPHLSAQARLLAPMRRARRGEAPQAVSWDTALDDAAQRIAAIVREHGPDAVGFYISGQLLTEDYYVFNKLAKGLLGTNNVDTNSRLCMSSAVAGYKATLGADAPPACYDDFKHAHTIFITGSNTAYAHPILFRRLEDARAANPGMKLIVADPRKTETAEVADLHLPILPGTDVALYHGMLHVMMWEGLIAPDYIAAHTSGFDELRNTVREFTAKEAARICGIQESDLVQAAKWFGQSSLAGTPDRTRSTLSLYCQGLNQSSSGTDKNAALINLHLATGQIGKPGAGPFSLTGQPNAMGGREVGGMANLLSAHRDLANPDHRAEVARLWGVADVPAAPGKTAVEMFEAAADGQIKALWIACTNPAQSMPDQATVRRALERAELVIVQEAYGTTITCDYADLLLPATSWGEKDGTVTNSERRISRVLPAVAAPGQARHDWDIVNDFARRLEALLPARLNGQTTLFPYTDAESIWVEHRESTRGRDLDITGLSYEILLSRGPQQWPMPEGAETGKVRLYEDGVFPTADGRARFAAVAFKPVAEPRDARYPFSLTTGRLRDQWHGMSRTGTLGRLYGHVSEPTIDLHPSDLARLRIKDGDLVHVTSRRGSIVLPAAATESVQPTQAFIAMHWGEEVLSGVTASGYAATGVNALTTPTFCPKSKQPELKHAAVKVLKAELPWALIGLAWLPQESALAAREELRALMPEFSYAACVPFGREPSERGQTGLLFRAAATEAVSDELLQRLETILGLNGADMLRYHDRRRGQHRAMKLDRSDAAAPRLRAFLLGGDVQAQGWLRTLLQEELDAQAYGRLLLAPTAQAPAALARRGRQVCTCFNVTEPQINEALGTYTGTEETRFAQLQTDLKCGTNCGSCIPELKKIIRLQLQPA
ncbi:MAG: nitrate reductase [Aquabacterium sp.]|nr:MAG: nitrate reductase [Aquabacterium sp.]